MITNSPFEPAVGLIVIELSFVFATVLPVTVAFATSRRWIPPDAVASITLSLIVAFTFLPIIEIAFAFADLFVAQ